MGRKLLACEGDCPSFSFQFPPIRSEQRRICFELLFGWIGAAQERYPSCVLLLSSHSDPANIATPMIRKNKNVLATLLSWARAAPAPSSHRHRTRMRSTPHQVWIKDEG